MRNQQLASGLALCAVTLCVSAALAQAPAASARNAGKAHEHGQGHPSDGERGRSGDAKADLGKADEKSPADKDKDKADSGKDGRPDKPGRPGSMRALFEELKTGKLKKQDVKARLAELGTDRDERKQQHRQQLKERWGNTLTQPAAREELEHHARRVARLNRAMVLAETEVTKDKDKLKERINKLMEQENTRHERAMARLQASSPAAAGGSAAPPAAAAPAADKAGEK